ncbi:MAG: hypothetical protein ABW167_21690 [Baekduia sp.]
MRVEVEGYGLEMVVVNKESLRLLGTDWDTPGFYILLGRSQESGMFAAYVGEATTQSLRSRVSQHVRSEKDWDRALLVTGQGFDSAAIGYLEGRFYDVLTNAAAAEVLNRRQPKDETVAEYRRAALDRYVEPVTLALRALGCPPDTADQRPTAARRKRRVFTESVSDLIDAGLLKAGTRLRPLRKRFDTPATVLPDGSLEVGGTSFATVSAAAKAVTGTSSEAGWVFWVAPSGDGSLVSLADLRARLREGASGVPVEPRAVRRPAVSAGARVASPATRSPRHFAVTIEQLIDAGLLNDGETILALRKRLEQVTATVHRDGFVTVDGHRHKSLSGAAKAVAGTTAEPGWRFWGVRRAGRVVSLYEVRATYPEASSGRG